MLWVVPLRGVACVGFFRFGGCLALWFFRLFPGCEFACGAVCAACGGACCGCRATGGGWRISGWYVVGGCGRGRWWYCVRAVGVRVVCAVVVGGACFVGVRIGAGVCVAAACVIVASAAACVGCVGAWRGVVSGESEGDGVECGGVFLDGEACAFHVALGACVCLRFIDDGVCLRARVVDDAFCFLFRVLDDGVGLFACLLECFFEGGGDAVERVVRRFVAVHAVSFSYVRVACLCDVAAPPRPFVLVGRRMMWWSLFV